MHTTIGFNHTKLVVRIVGCTLGVLLMLFVVRTAQSAVIPLVLAAFLAGFGGLSAVALMTGRPALELDEHGITLNNLLTSQTVGWADVADARFQSMTLYYLGFIPAARHEHLIVKTSGSWLSAKRIQVSTRLMELPSGGPSELMALIEAARRSAAGAPPGREPPGRERQLPKPEFDPDAAIARYIASKADQDGAPPTPPRPTFGRKQV